jgi:hypothetical protein
MMLRPIGSCTSTMMLPLKKIRFVLLQKGFKF